MAGNSAGESAGETAGGAAGRRGGSAAATIGAGESVSVSESVYRRLRAELMAGQFQPGGKLSIRRLSQCYGVSFTPVREAIKRLVAEGGLDVHSNRTFRIPSLSDRQKREILQLRLNLEGEAAAEAARKVNITFLRRLATIDRKLTRAARRGDAAAVRELNRQFHFAVYRRSDNATLLLLIENLWLRYASSYDLGGGADRPIRSFSQHQRLLDALEKGDAAAARRAIVRDLSERSVLA